MNTLDFPSYRMVNFRSTSKVPAYETYLSTRHAKHFRSICVEKSQYAGEEVKKNIRVHEHNISL